MCDKCLQVVIDKLEPMGNVLLRNPLLPGIVSEQQQQEQLAAAGQAGSTGDSSDGQSEKLQPCRLMGVSGEDDDLIIPRAQVCKCVIRSPHILLEIWCAPLGCDVLHAQLKQQAQSRPTHITAAC
jgi:hypothetical protein